LALQKAKAIVQYRKGVVEQRNTQEQEVLLT